MYYIKCPLITGILLLIPILRFYLNIRMDYFELLKVQAD